MNLPDRIIYYMLESYEEEVRAMCIPDAGKQDDLLKETLEWGWEHAAPPGERYRPRKTLYLTEDLDLAKAQSEKLADTGTLITSAIEKLIAKVRDCLNGELANQITLSALAPTHGERDEKGRGIFTLTAQIVFQPAEPEPDVPASPPKYDASIYAVRVCNASSTIARYLHCLEGSNLHEDVHAMVVEDLTHCKDVLTNFLSKEDAP